MVTVKIEINPQGEKNLDALKTALIGKMAIDVEAYAKMKAPVDTGAMRAGIHYSQLSPLVMLVSSQVDYDIYWEEGTRYHFLPFFTDGQINDFGRWAMRVIGMSEEALTKSAGMMVHAERRQLYKGGLEEAIKNARSGSYQDDILSEARKHGYTR